jgi:site-specific recombinase XerC
MRTIVDLSERQMEALGRISKHRKLSLAELIRQAVDRYLAEYRPELGAAFGLWKRAGARVDGIAYQRRLRREWSR